MRISPLFAAVLVLLFLAGCESENASYNRGYSRGYQEGATLSQRERYEEGFEAGFKAARPAQRPSLPSEAITTVTIAAFFGAAKIILGLCLCVVLVVMKSHSWQGQVAASLAGLLSSFTAFLVLSLTYVDQALVPILLASADWPRALLLVPISLGWVAGYYSTKMLRSIVRHAEGIYLEVLIVVVVSALATVLTSILAKVFFNNPDPASYIISYLLCGFFIGGSTIFIRIFMDQERDARAVANKGTSRR